MSTTMYDPMKWNAKNIGIPVSREQHASIPYTEAMVTLPGGVKVVKRIFESFKSELAQYGSAIVKNPSAAPGYVEGLGQRLVALHIAELNNHTAAMSRHYDQPAEARWQSSQESLKDQMRQKPGTVARSKAVVAKFGSVVGGAKAQQFLDMASRTGCGNEPIMHEMLNVLHQLLGLEKAEAKAEGREDTPSARMYRGAGAAPSRAPASTAAPSKPAASPPPRAAPASKAPASPTKTRASAAVRLHGKDGKGAQIANAAPAKAAAPATNPRTRSRASRMYGPANG